MYLGDDDEYEAAEKLRAALRFIAQAAEYLSGLPEVAAAEALSTVGLIAKEALRRSEDAIPRRGPTLAEACIAAVVRGGVNPPPVVQPVKRIKAGEVAFRSK